MTNIPIPDSIVAAVVAAEQARNSNELTEKIITDLSISLPVAKMARAQAPAKPAPRPQPAAANKPSIIEDTTNVDPEELVDGRFLVRAVRNEQGRRDEMPRARQMAATWHSVMRRPKVFVTETINNGFEIVKTRIQLERLFGAIPAENIHLEEAYAGPDANNVMVLRCMLPPNYVARVPYVRVCDIPARYFALDGVAIRRIISKFDGTQDTIILCRNMPPMLTDRPNFEIPLETVQKYNCVTVKIRLEDHSLKCWFPGIDKASQPCQTLNEMCALIGDHFAGEGDEDMDDVAPAQQQPQRKGIPMTAIPQQQHPQRQSRRR